MLLVSEAFRLEPLKYRHLTAIFSYTVYMFIILQVNQKLSLCTSYTEVYNND